MAGLASSGIIFNVYFAFNHKKIPINRKFLRALSQFDMNYFRGYKSKKSTLKIFENIGVIVMGIMAIFLAINYAFSFL